MNIYDCIIIGGSISGLSAGLTLKNKNFSVVILSDIVCLHETESNLDINIRILIEEALKDSPKTIINIRKIKNILKQSDNNLFKIEVEDEIYLGRKLILTSEASKEIGIKFNCLLNKDNLLQTDTLGRTSEKNIYASNDVSKKEKQSFQTSLYSGEQIANTVYLSI